jgi:broad specificity phosphatase PhoE
MTRLYLVRHGRAAAGYAESADPGLDETGHVQADAVAQRLASLGPLAIVSSPLRRALETAVPLARLWQCEPVIEPVVAEIPSPPLGLTGRGAWLHGFMQGSWHSASPILAQWRQEAIGALVSLSEDTVIFSHFIAINVAAGASLDNDRVILFHPDNCSVTIFDVEAGRLRLVERGHEAETRVN